MLIQNWRDTAPTIVHDYGIDYKLLKGQAFYDEKIAHCCMRGMLYVAYAMLQSGKAYQPHSHADHEEVYYIISGFGSIRVGEQQSDIRSGDAIYIPAGEVHSISNTAEEFLIFLAFSAQISENNPKQGGDPV